MGEAVDHLALRSSVALADRYSESSPRRRHEPREVTPTLTSSPVESTELKTLINELEKTCIRALVASHSVNHDLSCGLLMSQDEIGQLGERWIQATELDHASSLSFSSPSLLLEEERYQLRRSLWCTIIKERTIHTSSD